jgi:DNA-binding Lrp family transcriptional regulator
MQLDDYDLRILSALQENSSLTGAELAEIVRLSGSQCSRRKAALEAAGFIAGYHARLAPRKLGYGFLAITRVNLREHSEKGAEEFVRFLASHGEVQEAFSVSGDADYILKIRARDLDEFAQFIHRHLLPNPQVSLVRSDIVLKTMKEDHGLPIGGN